LYSSKEKGQKSGKILTIFEPWAVSLVFYAPCGYDIGKIIEWVGMFAKTLRFILSENYYYSYKLSNNTLAFWE
jgi:hypothetical protein